MRIVIVGEDDAGDRVVIREEIDANVYVVTGMGGRGMTLSPVVAEQTIEGLR